MRMRWRVGMTLALVMVLVVVMVTDVGAAGAVTTLRYLRVKVLALLEGPVLARSYVEVAGPTSVATSQPVLQVDSAGVSNLLEIRDAATPVYQVHDGGNVTASGGQAINNWVKVAAPTAITTATPAMVIDSSGVSTLLEVRKAATPVLEVLNAGGLRTLANAENVNLPSVVSEGVDIDNETSPVTLFTVADGEVWLVYTCVANVLADFDTGANNDATFQVGVSGAADMLLDLIDAELQTADADDGGPAGWQGLSESTQGTALDDASGSAITVFAPSGSDANIIATFAGTGLAGDGSAADDITVYLVYWRIQ